VCFALLNAGNNNAAMIAIIAMTTSNSINVKPRRLKLKRLVVEKLFFIIASKFHPTRKVRRPCLADYSYLIRKMLPICFSNALAKSQRRRTFPETSPKSKRRASTGRG
jgi:hypothetical protein